MELHDSNQISHTELNTINFDLFISVLGYEKRGTYLIEEFNIKATRKICLAYSEKQGILNRKENEALFRKKGFEIISFSGEKTFDIAPLIEELCQNSSGQIIKVLIDYSSMTKVWYSGFINALTELQIKCHQVQVFFSYTPALFDPSYRIKPAKLAYSVVPESRRRLASSKPLALIIGLGLDNKKAQMLIKSVKPAIIYCLYADPAHNIKYVQKLFQNNQSVIDSVEIRNVLNYPLNDLEKTYEILTRLCLDLRLRYNILIAPIGPKVFTLLTLVLSSRYPDIDVWRVTAGVKEPAIDRIGEGDPLVYRVTYSNEDN